MSSIALLTLLSSPSLTLTPGLQVWSCFHSVGFLGCRSFPNGVFANCLLKVLCKLRAIPLRGETHSVIRPRSCRLNSKNYTKIFFVFRWKACLVIVPTLNNKLNLAGILDCFHSKFYLKFIYALNSEMHAASSAVWLISGTAITKITLFHSCLNL